MQETTKILALNSFGTGKVLFRRLAAPPASLPLIHDRGTASTTVKPRIAHRACRAKPRWSSAFHFRVALRKGNFLRYGLLVTSAQLLALLFLKIK